MRLETDTLILEVTRDCNMACDHCMRGEPEDLYMDVRTVARAIRAFSDIRCIVFTGGEPTLNITAINQALHCCETKGIPVISAYIATNGKYVPDDFLSACDDWYMYCAANEYGTNKKIHGETLEKLARWVGSQRGNGSGLSVALSADDYHDPIPFGNLTRLMSRSYFSTDKFNTDWFHKKNSVLDTGRAKELLPKDRLRATDISRYYVEPDGDTLRFDTIYVNAKGYILPDCDLPYGQQEAYKEFNVNKEGWKEKIYGRFKESEE